MTTKIPAWLDSGMEHIWLPYTQMKGAPMPLGAVETRGARIRLADGRELIDGIASWWTACHGYNPPHIIDAMKRQLDAMPHVMLGGLVSEPAAELATRLAKLLPGDLERIFFSDSGSVSVEVALKMAVQYWINTGETGRTKFVSFLGGYHGDTTGCMAVCDPEEGMHSLFAGLLTENHFRPLPVSADEVAAFDAFVARHRRELAGIVVEPLVQGAGGMLMHHPETLRAIADIAARHGVLFIVDEVFTGFGRTGTMFAVEQAGVVPDIVCLGKALTGGVVGLAATVAREHVFEAFLSDDPGTAFMHGPTFMGNPLACAAANASLDLFETEPRLEQVRAIESLLEDALTPCRGIDGVRDVRVLGAIGCVELECADDIPELKRRFVDLGLWLRPFGNIVYTTPAFVISEEDLHALTSGIETALGER